MWRIQLSDPTTMPPKRYAEEDDEGYEGSNKRRKFDKPSSIIASIDVAMHTFNKAIGNVNQKLPDAQQVSWEFNWILLDIPRSLLKPGTTGKEVSAELEA